MLKQALSRRDRKAKHYLRRSLVFLIVIVVVGGAFFWWFPAPRISPTLSLPTVTQTKVVLPWPTYGEAAIGAIGFGLIQSHGSSSMLPTASVAKIITALSVLKKYPLSLGQQGPTITLGPSDVALYEHYAGVGGSVIRVVNGEQLSEYQAIQAMLLPSANNIADSLAVWAFGSLPAYVIAANQYVKSLGLNKTTVSDDASGYLPGTKSTPNDLVELGQAALSNQVLKQIVGQKTADLPVVGLVNNVNWLLGSDGVVGIKTGNTDQAGGVYLFAVNYPIDATVSVEIVGSVMGAPSLQQAINDSVPLINAAKVNFQDFNLLKVGQVVGHYRLPWDDKDINAVAAKNVTAVAWSGALPKLQVSLKKISAPAGFGSDVGTIKVSQNSSNVPVQVILGEQIKSPPLLWRLFRIHS